MIKIKWTLNFTNTIGAIGLILGVIYDRPEAYWPCALMVLGRAGVEIIKAYKGASNDKTID